MKAANWKFKVKSHCQWGRKLAVLNLCPLDSFWLKLQDESRHIVFSFFLCFFWSINHKQGAEKQSSGSERKIENDLMY